MDFNLDGYAGSFAGLGAFPGFGAPPRPAPHTLAALGAAQQPPGPSVAARPLRAYPLVQKVQTKIAAEHGDAVAQRWMLAIEAHPRARAVIKALDHQTATRASLQDTVARMESAAIGDRRAYPATGVLRSYINTLEGAAAWYEKQPAVVKFGVSRLAAFSGAALPFTVAQFAAEYSAASEWEAQLAALKALVPLVSSYYAAAAAEFETLTIEVLVDARAVERPSSSPGAIRQAPSSRPRAPGRDVYDDDGVWRYRQFPDGSVMILAAPPASARAVGRVLTAGTAWTAITSAIGPYEPPTRVLPPARAPSQEDEQAIRFEVRPDGSVRNVEIDPVAVVQAAGMVAKAGARVVKGAGAKAAATAKKVGAAADKRQDERQERRAALVAKGATVVQNVREERAERKATQAARDGLFDRLAGRLQNIGGNRKDAKAVAAALTTSGYKGDLDVRDVKKLLDMSTAERVLRRRKLEQAAADERAKARGASERKLRRIDDELNLLVKYEALATPGATRVAVNGYVTDAPVFGTQGAPGTAPPFTVDSTVTAPRGVPTPGSVSIPRTALDGSDFAGFNGWQGAWGDADAAADDAADADAGAGAGADAGASDTDPGAAEAPAAPAPSAGGATKPKPKGRKAPLSRRERRQKVRAYRRSLRGLDGIEHPSAPINTAAAYGPSAFFLKQAARRLEIADRGEIVQGGVRFVIEQVRFVRAYLRARLAPTLTFDRQKLKIEEIARRLDVALQGQDHLAVTRYTLTIGLNDPVVAAVEGAVATELNRLIPGLAGDPERLHALWCLRRLIAVVAAAGHPVAASKLVLSFTGPGAMGAALEREVLLACGRGGVRAVRAAAITTKVEGGPSPVTRGVAEKGLAVAHTSAAASAAAGQTAVAQAGQGAPPGVVQAVQAALAQGPRAVEAAILKHQPPAPVVEAAQNALPAAGLVALVGRARGVARSAGASAMAVARAAPGEVVASSWKATLGKIGPWIAGLALVGAAFYAKRAAGAVRDAATVAHAAGRSIFSAGGGQQVPQLADYSAADGADPGAGLAGALPAPPRVEFLTVEDLDDADDDAEDAGAED